MGRSVQQMDFFTLTDQQYWRAQCCQLSESCYRHRSVKREFGSQEVCQFPFGAGTVDFDVERPISIHNGIWKDEGTYSQVFIKDHVQSRAAHAEHADEAGQSPTNAQLTDNLDVVLQREAGTNWSSPQYANQLRVRDSIDGNSIHRGNPVTDSKQPIPENRCLGKTPANNTTNRKNLLN